MSSALQERAGLGRAPEQGSDHQMLTLTKNTDNEKAGEGNLLLIAEEMELETPEFLYLTIPSLLDFAQL